MRLLMRVWWYGVEDGFLAPSEMGLTFLFDPARVSGRAYHRGRTVGTGLGWLLWPLLWLAGIREAR